jgi:murein DD-endopeptidase MepM/ murein hydrolase activator NlpD
MAHRPAPRRRTSALHLATIWTTAFVGVAVLTLAMIVIAAEPSPAAITLERARLQLAQAEQTLTELTEARSAAQSAAVTAAARNQSAEAEVRRARARLVAAVRSDADRLLHRAWHLEDGGSGSAVARLRDHLRERRLRAAATERQARAAADAVGQVTRQLHDAARRAETAERWVSELTDELTHAAGPERLAAQILSTVARPEADASAPLAWPLDGPVTAGYGPRLLPPVGSPIHNGMDVFALPGTPVVSAGEGVVRTATSHQVLGNVVVVDHQPDDAGQRVATVYAHLERIDVEVGDRLAAGDQLGAVGATGSTAAGPHLHFEVLVNDQPVDPRGWLPARR